MRIQMNQENGEMGQRDHISLRNYSFYFLQWSVFFRFLLCLTSSQVSEIQACSRLVMTFIGCSGLQMCTAGRGWNVAPETDVCVMTHIEVMRPDLFLLFLHLNQGESLFHIFKRSSAGHRRCVQSWWSQQSSAAPHLVLLVPWRL